MSNEQPSSKERGCYVMDGVMYTSHADGSETSRKATDEEVLLADALLRATDELRGCFRELAIERRAAQRTAHEPPDSIWGDGTREMLIQLRDWLRSKMPCPAGDCCNELRDWIHKVDQHISFHAPAATQPPPAALTLEQIERLCSMLDHDPIMAKDYAAVRQWFNSVRASQPPRTLLDMIENDRARREAAENACAEFVKMQHDIASILGVDADTDSIDLHGRIYGALSTRASQPPGVIQLEGECQYCRKWVVLRTDTDEVHPLTITSQPAETRCHCGTHEWPPNTVQIEDSRGRLHTLHGCQPRAAITKEEPREKPHSAWYHGLRGYDCHTCGSFSATLEGTKEIERDCTKCIPHETSGDRS